MKRNFAMACVAALLVLGVSVSLHSAEPAAATAGDAAVPRGKIISLFDGKTLDGWIQEPAGPTSLSGGDITDYAALAKKLQDTSNPVSVALFARLDDAGRSSLTQLDTADAAALKAAKSALVKSLNKIVSGPTVYDAAAFKAVQLRPETEQLRQQNPEGKKLLRLNRVLLEDAYPTELAKSPSSSWIVKDGAMASTGAGRGIIYTKDDYTKYRLMFTMRHVSGQPDHQPCFLIFCTRPVEGEKPLDALGGIQFQVPNGGHWDYRPGQNKAGLGFTNPVKPKFDNKQWSRVEILVDATKGTARMAVAQPVDAQAVEVLDFNVPEAGKTGPIAWQMHNAGLFDEYKDVTIEIDPKDDVLVTTN
jgi:Domain of Unknown Function (DUF1080)